MLTIYFMCRVKFYVLFRFPDLDSVTLGLQSVLPFHPLHNR